MIYQGTSTKSIMKMIEVIENMMIAMKTILRKSIQFLNKSIPFFICTIFYIGRIFVNLNKLWRKNRILL